MPTSLIPVEDADDTSKAERVYRYLRHRIRGLDLPPGERLEKNDIARQCGVSRAPVSDAITRLASEGLVDVFPQSGSFVAPIRPEDVYESMLIRMGLEIETVRRVAQLGDPTLLERMDANLDAQAAAIRRGDMLRLDDLDEAFHTIFLGALKSPRAQRLLDATRAVLDRPRFHALPQEGRPEATLAEHRRIADAVRTGDPELAGATMRIHLTRVMRAIESRTAQIALESRVVQRKPQKRARTRTRGGES
jgi:GntR family transcriptional regulator, rspAB operon transcriptional repressor